jgi:hypothetical protein
MCPYSAVAPVLAEAEMPPTPDTAPSDSTNCVIAAADAKTKHTSAVTHLNELTKISVKQAGGLQY